MLDSDPHAKNRKFTIVRRISPKEAS